MVLPLVPVTPTATSRSPGASCAHAATGPAIARGSSATRTGIRRARPESSSSAAPASSVRTATAPASTACAAYVAPCTWNPVTATNTSPGDHVAAGQAHAGQHGVGRQRRTPCDQAERRDEVGDPWAAGCSGRIRAGVVMGRIYPAGRSPTPGAGRLTTSSGTASRWCPTVPRRAR